MKIPDKYDTVFALQFEDPELADVEVKIRLSFGLVDSAAELVTVDAEAIAAGNGNPEDLRKLRALVDDFAGALVSWNLDGDDGQPLPTDRDAVRAQDFRLVLVLVHAFQNALIEQAQEQREAAQVDESMLPVQAG